MSKAIRKRLAQVLHANSIIRSLGDYDSAIVGVVGEIYAETHLGMKKAPRGEKAIDGYIGERSVSIKAKESDKPGRYITITDAKRPLVHDLVVVVLQRDGFICHHGPVPMPKIEPYFNSKGRLSLSVLEQLGFPLQCSGIKWNVDYSAHV